jgi:hypothetical protein
MSGRKNISVIRTYKHEPENCARALALLLSKSVSKKGGSPTAPKDDVKESNGYVATSSIPGPR